MIRAVRSEGFVTCTVATRPGQRTGAVVSAKASIVFDVNAPIATPTFHNTLDSLPPTASMKPLPKVEKSPAFRVAWTGHDDRGGSGIATFDLYVSIDRGRWELRQSGVPQTKVTFRGRRHHRYAFYVVAADQAGNRQQLRPRVEAVTQVR